MAGAISSFFVLVAGAMFFATVVPTSGLPMVWFASQGVKMRTGSIQAKGQTDVFIELTATAGDTSAALPESGTGYWELSIFASKEDNVNTADPLLKQDQILTTADQNKGVAASEALVFNVQAQYEVGQMKGCDGDYRFFCMSFSKGGSPKPDFDLFNGISQCMELDGLKCNRK